MALGIEDLLHAGQIAERLALRDPVSVPWRLAAAEALLALDDRTRAADLASRHLELARRKGIPEAIGPALRVQGLIAGSNPGPTVLAEAVEQLEGGFARLELALAVVDLGAATQKDDPAGARPLLARGATLAEELGTGAREDGRIPAPRGLSQARDQLAAQAPRGYRRRRGLLGPRSPRARPEWSPSEIGGEFEESSSPMPDLVATAPG